MAVKERYTAVLLDFLSTCEGYKVSKPIVQYLRPLQRAIETLASVKTVIFSLTQRLLFSSSLSDVNLNMLPRSDVAN